MPSLRLLMGMVFLTALEGVVVTWLADHPTHPPLTRDFTMSLRGHGRQTGISPQLVQHRLGRVADNLPGNSHMEAVTQAPQQVLRLPHLEFTLKDFASSMPTRPLLHRPLHHIQPRQPTPFRCTLIG